MTKKNIYTMLAKSAINVTIKKLDDELMKGHERDLNAFMLKEYNENGDKEVGEVVIHETKGNFTSVWHLLGCDGYDNDFDTHVNINGNEIKITKLVNLVTLYGKNYMTCIRHTIDEQGTATHVTFWTYEKDADGDGLMYWHRCGRVHWYE